MCRAYQEGEPQRYPVKTKKIKRTSQSLWLLWAQNPRAEVWLEKRPAKGVWANLYCLPLFDSIQALEAAIPKGHELVHLEPFLHVLTHKDLHLHPVRVTCKANENWSAKEEEKEAQPFSATQRGQWMAAHQWQSLGLPAPIRKLLQK